MPPSSYAFGPFRLVPAERRLLEGAEPIRLQPRAFELLAYLVAQAGRHVSREELRREVWGGVFVGEAALHQMVRRVRAALRDDADQPRYIETVAKAGWRFVAEVVAHGASSGSGAELFGREAELEAVRTAGPLLALVGLPGVGKTSIAREAARRFGGTWVDGSRAGDAGGLARAVAAGLGLSLQGVSDEGLGAVAAALRAAPVLLVIDDADPGALERLAEAIARTGARLVVTARRRVPGFEELVVGPLAPDAALALFEARGRAAGPRGAELVARLEHHPLSIELAAARTALLTVDEMLTRLDRRFQLLRTAAEGRHASLEAALGASWEALSDAEQRLLADLTAFPGRFSVDDAEAIAGSDIAPWPLDALQGLREACLVQAGEGSRRFGLLDSVRDYAAARSPERAAAARERFVTRALELGERASERLYWRPDPEARAALDALVDDLVAAARLTAATDPERAGRAIFAAWRSVRVSGPLGLVAPWVEALLPRVSGDLALHLGLIDASIARRRGAANALDRTLAVLERAKEAGRDARVREALLLAAGIANDRGRSDLALTLADEALQLADAAGIASDAAAACIAQFMALRSLGRLSEAPARLREGLSRCRTPDEDESRVACLSNLAIVDHEAGRYDDAEISYREAIDLWRALGDEWRRAVLLGNLANLYVDSKRPELAPPLFDEAIAVAERSGDRAMARGNRGNLAVLWLGQGRVAEASAALERVLADAVAAGHDRHAAWAGMTLGIALREEGRAGAAEARLRRAAEVASGAGLEGNESQARLWLAALLADRDAIADARTEIARAEELGVAAPVGVALAALARGHVAAALARAGDAEAAEGARAALREVEPVGRTSLEVGIGARWLADALGRS